MEWKVDKTEYMGGIRSTYLKITSDNFLSALHWLEKTIPNNTRSEWLDRCAKNGYIGGDAKAVLWVENGLILLCGNCEDCKYICDAIEEGIFYQHIVREEKLKRITNG